MILSSGFFLKMEKNVTASFAMKNHINNFNTKNKLSYLSIYSIILIMISQISFKLSLKKPGNDLNGNIIKLIWNEKFKFLLFRAFLGDFNQLCLKRVHRPYYNFSIMSNWRSLFKCIKNGKEDCNFFSSYRNTLSKYFSKPYTLCKVFLVVFCRLSPYSQFTTGTV